MLDLDCPVPDIVARITFWVESGDENEVTRVAQFARSGFKAWRGSKRPRSDALGVLVERTVQGLTTKLERFPATLEVIKNLWLYDLSDDFKGTLQEIDGGSQVLYWVDGRGREQSTTFSAFHRRVQRLRNKLNARQDTMS